MENITNLSTGILNQDIPPMACSCPVCQGIKPPLLENESRQRNNLVLESTDYQIAALDSTYRWSNPTTITYSFYETGSGYNYGSETGVSEVSEAIKNNVRYILENIYEPLINVDFQEVSDSSNSYGRIRVMHSNNPGYAYAYYPHAHPLGGDVHLSPSPNYENDANNRFSGSPGNHGYMALIHELGHAMGLKHPGDYNGGGTGDPPFLPYGEDNTSNTVMTYNFTGNSAGYLMPYDIKTLQYIYGAKATNSGNTTYNFTSTHGYTVNGQTWGSTTTRMKLAIYDGSGTDVVDVSNLAFNSSGYRIDLSENGIITPQNVYNARSYTAIGDSSGTTYNTSTYGTRIAFNTFLENVVNSTSNDYIIANSAANIFSGYSPTRSTANDTIVGSNNLDILDLSSFSSVTQTQSGNNLVVSLGTGKSVTVQDYYTQAANQRLQILLQTPVLVPTVSIANAATVLEGSNTQAVFTVTLSSAATNPVTIQYQTSNISATSGEDYTTTTGTVTINAGQTTANINVPIVNNNLPEADETFQVTLTNPQNATITQATATATITDTLTASVTTTLTTGIENLTLTGIDNINGTGNANNNIITGNSGNNSLSGGSGTGLDTLIGGGGNDTLNGGVGADSLEGGTGDDAYTVDNIGDVVTELTGEGSDRVTSSITYTLPNNVERLTLNGTSATNGTGNSLNNTITGNGGANSLNGLEGNDTIGGNAGNDILTGGTGNDVLTGGLNNDIFVFNSKTEGLDTIKDLSLTEDVIQISATGFGGGLVVGSLPVDQFVLGSAALDTGDRFIYRQSDGSLFFDEDGIGATSQILLATLSNKVALTAANLAIVA